MSAPAALTNTSAPDDFKKKIMMWAIITSIFLMWVFFYVAYQVFAPEIVQEGERHHGADGSCARRPVDNGKCFMYSFVTMLVFMVFIWILLITTK
jgi:magnesium-transporting ATPase (P-type)